MSNIVVSNKKEKEKNKEFYLFNNYIPKKEDKKNNKGKNKINEINKLNASFSKIKDDNGNKNGDLMRIISKTSLSTYKSSDYQEDFSSANENDSISLFSDSSQSNYQNNNESRKDNHNNLNENNKYINTNNKFINFYYNYYDEGIRTYCSITYNNLAILNNFKEQYLKKIETLIKENLKFKYDMEFHYYGSYSNGLSIEGSDIDICIIYKKKDKNNLNFGFELYNFLKQNEYNNEFLYETVAHLEARVPIVTITIDISKQFQNVPLNNNFKYLKYNDLYQIKIDFTFSEDEQFWININNSIQYIKKELDKYSIIKPIILVIKRYLKINNMNVVYNGGISSYSVFLMVLNTIKSYLKDIPNNQINVTQLLVLVFKKFSFFKFEEFGIGKDNYDYKLEENNLGGKPYIIDPLTGINIAGVGKCTGKQIRDTFEKGYKLLCNVKNNLNYYFQNGYYLFNFIPFLSFVELFK